MVPHARATWLGGMTLPTPHYLMHAPQYLPTEPVFPLQRELDPEIQVVPVQRLIPASR